LNVLLIEDEEKVSRFIRKGLEEQTFSVDVAYDGATGLRMAENGGHDVIILDIVLPGQNGFEVCKTIRQENPDVPILMLTALDSVNDKVNGFHNGADDYLTKPFHFQELVVRLEALRRRNNLSETTKQVIEVADLRIDLEAKEVRRGGDLIRLTAREFRLLTLFARRKGRVLSRAVIAEKIWERSFESGSNVIDVYVNYLRNKIDQGREKKLIHTVIGMGYVLRE